MGVGTCVGRGGSVESGCGGIHMCGGTRVWRPLSPHVKGVCGGTHVWGYTCVGLL